MYFVRVCLVHPAFFAFICGAQILFGAALMPIHVGAIPIVTQDIFGIVAMNKPFFTFHLYATTLPVTAGVSVQDVDACGIAAKYLCCIYLQDVAGGRLVRVASSCSLAAHVPVNICACPALTILVESCIPNFFVDKGTWACIGAAFCLF
jgi:hypothetical protein